MHARSLLICFFLIHCVVLGEIEIEIEESDDSADSIAYLLNGVSVDARSTQAKIEDVAVKIYYSQIDPDPIIVMDVVKHAIEDLVKDFYERYTVRHQEKCASSCQNVRQCADEISAIATGSLDEAVMAIVDQCSKIDRELSRLGEIYENIEQIATGAEHLLSQYESAKEWCATNEDSNECFAELKNEFEFAEKGNSSLELLSNAIANWHLFERLNDMKLQSCNTMYKAVFQFTVVLATRGLQECLDATNFGSEYRPDLDSKLMQKVLKRMPRAKESVEDYYKVIFDEEWYNPQNLD